MNHVGSHIAEDNWVGAFLYAHETNEVFLRVILENTPYLVRRNADRSLDITMYVGDWEETVSSAHFAKEEWVLMGVRLMAHLMELREKVECPVPDTYPVAQHIVS